MASDIFCCYCGNIVSIKDVTKDHLIPLSKGGRNYMQNKKDCCQKCNHMKGCMYPEQFLVFVILNRSKFNEYDFNILVENISHVITQIKFHGASLFKTQVHYKRYLEITMQVTYNPIESMKLDAAMLKSKLNIKHTEALELVSKTNGYVNWHHALAKNKQS